MTEHRRDRGLRQAINNIHALLMDRNSDKCLYEHLLEHLIDLSGAHYGVIYPCNDEALHTQYIIHRDEEGDTTQEEARSNCPLNLFWTDWVATGRACLINQRLSQEQLDVFPSNHPVINNALFLPIISEQKVLAAALLTNRDSGFEQDLLVRLHPLLTAAECVYRASQSIDVIPSPDALLHGNYNKHLVGLINASLNGVITVDENYAITTFNRAAETIFGIHCKDAMGRSLQQFVRKGEASEQNPEQHQSFEHRFNLNEQMPFLSTKVFRGIVGRRQNGDEFLIDMSVFQSQLENKYQTTFVIEDISDRIDSANELKENLQRFKALTQLAPVGIIQVDADWNCIYANDTWCELCGFSEEETLGEQWINAIHKDDLPGFLQAVRDHIDINKAYTAEFRIETPLGHTTWVKVNARALYSSDGSVKGFLATVADITSHLDSERRLRDMAEFDTLTGLVNRAFFQDRLTEALAGSARHGNVILLFIDLDDFKVVNDTLGHDIGDELLKIVAHRVKDVVRTEDTVARLGGDEFTVILKYLQDESYASRVAQNIIQSMRDPFIINGQEIFISASIGVAVGNADNCDPQTLTKQADIALYRAKEEGRNNFQFYTPELDVKSRTRMMLTNSLHRALERQELTLYYQPQVAMDSGKIIGVEALLRWKNSDVGNIEPSLFIPLLEETGLIEPVGQWVIKTACQQLGQWLRQKLVDDSVTMSVNVSTRQLRDRHLANSIGYIIENAGIRAEQLVIEITESVLFENTEQNQRLMTQIRDLGCRISLDDFGTGYSSMAYLKKFPIDHIKIDQSFIKDILVDPDDKAIVSAILALADNLGLTVIAEGVENREVLDALEAMGCPFYQGHYFSEPKSAEQIAADFFTNSAVKRPSRTVPTGIDSLEHGASLKAIKRRGTH